MLTVDRAGGWRGEEGLTDKWGPRLLGDSARENLERYLARSRVMLLVMLLRDVHHRQFNWFRECLADACAHCNRSVWV